MARKGDGEVFIQKGPQIGVLFSKGIFVVGIAERFGEKFSPGIEVVVIELYVRGIESLAGGVELSEAVGQGDSLVAEDMFGKSSGFQKGGPPDQGCPFGDQSILEGAGSAIIMTGEGREVGVRISENPAPNPENVWVIEIGERRLEEVGVDAAVIIDEGDQFRLRHRSANVSSRCGALIFGQVRPSIPESGEFFPEVGGDAVFDDDDLHLSRDGLASFPKGAQALLEMGGFFPEDDDSADPWGRSST